MKKGVVIIGLILIVGCSNSRNNFEVTNEKQNDNIFQPTQQASIDTNVDEANSIDISNSFFFKNDISLVEYDGTVSFDKTTETTVNLNINELNHFIDGKLYELKLEPIEGIPEDRLNLGYFYVQKDKIYKIDATQENLNQLKASELLPEESVIVCQEQEMKDSLGQEETGWHHYIEINGDKRIYHSYNNQVSTGYYESFTWEKGSGFINYSSGYGAGRDSIDISIERKVNKEDTVNKDKDIYTNVEAGFEMSLPRSWEGKYKIDEWDKGTRFIHLIDGNEGDTLFSISIFGSVEEWRENGDYPYEYIGENRGEVYVSKSPSESSYDYNTDQGKSYIDEYQSLIEALGNIEDRVEFIDNK